MSTGGQLYIMNQVKSFMFIVAIFIAVIIAIGTSFVLSSVQQNNIVRDQSLVSLATSTGIWVVVNKTADSVTISFPFPIYLFGTGASWIYTLKNETTGEIREVRSPKDYAVGVLISAEELKTSR